MYCPLCGSSLELKQINFTIAIYMCIDLKCPYPANGQCFKVDRKLADMKKFSQHHTAPNNNSTGSLNQNITQPLQESPKGGGDLELNLLIENTLMNLDNYMSQTEIPSTFTNGQDSPMISNKTDQIKTNDHGQFDELESIFNELI